MSLTPLTLRPTYGGALGTGWSLTGAASLSAALSDDLDTSYVASSGSTAGNCTFSCPPTSFPALSQIRSVTPRYRFKHLTTPSGVNGLRVELTGETFSATGPDWTQGTTNFATYTGVTRTINPNTGLPWAAADFNVNTLSGFFTTTYGLSWINSQVAELYFDVVYNEAPVTSGVGVTSNLTTKPTVTWTYTDPENDNQERYRVKIYAGSGTISDPDNTTALYDSGEVLSSFNQHNVTAALPGSPAGTTYRIYVKTADVGSSGRYGLWATATVNIQTDSLATPEILTYADSGLGRIGIIVQGHDNILLHNSDDFESFNNEWTPGTNAAALNKTTAQALHGLSSLLITPTAAGSTTTITLASGYRPTVSVGRMYTAMGWMRASTSGRVVRLDLQWYTSGGSLISTSQGLAMVDTTTGWVQLIASGIAPSTAVTVGIIVTIFNPSAATDTHYLDEAYISPVPIRNLLPLNTSIMEIDISGWVAASQATITSTSTTVFEGADALQVTATGATPTVSSLTGTSGVPVIPGRSYTATAQTRAGVTGRTCTASIIWYTAAGAVISTSSGTAITSTTTGWTLATVTATAPATAAFAAVQLQWTTANVNDTFFVDIVTLFIASTNLLTANQASIETDATGWTTTSNCSVARSTAQFLDGVASLMLTSTAAGTMSAKNAPANTVSVTVGVSYTASAAFMAAASARSVEVNINWRDASQSLLSTTSGTPVTDSTTGWTVATVTGTAPANAVYATVEVMVNSTGAASEVHYVDSIGIFLTSDVTWTVGDAAQTGTYVIVERSLDNGVTWTQVRGAVGWVLATLSGSAFDSFSTQRYVLYDYEVARTVSVLYRARVTSQFSLISSNAQAASALTTGATGWWLKDPLAPALNHQIEAMPPFDFTRKKPTSVFDPLGRNVSVAVTDGVKGIAGTLSIRCQSKARYDKLEAILANGRTLLLEDIFGRSWYIAQSGDSTWSFIRAQPTSSETTTLRYLHEVQIPFVQVGSPAGDTVAAGTPSP